MDFRDGPGGSLRKLPTLEERSAAQRYLAESPHQASTHTKHTLGWSGNGQVTAPCGHVSSSEK
jgi:hypothetical protein